MDRRNRRPTPITLVDLVPRLPARAVDVPVTERTGYVAPDAATLARWAAAQQKAGQ